jgi:two-component system, NtrC family, response regulator AtoC
MSAHTDQIAHTDKRNEVLKTIDFNLNVLQLMHNKNKLVLTEKAKEKLMQYEWPADPQMIEDVLEKAVQKCKNNHIEPEDIDLILGETELEVPVGLKLETVERQYILQTLYFVQQNRTKAAEVLGISIRTLRNKLNQYRSEGHL